MEFPRTWMLILLAVTTLVVGVLFVFSLVGFQQVNAARGQVKQPAVVLSLLDELIAEDADYEEILEKYVVPNESTSGLGSMRDSLSFSYILDAEEVTGYEVIQSSEGYLEFALLDEAGEPTYPLVVFAYVLTDAGDKIADYSLGRLQPFSRLHPEYGEEWN